MVLYDSQHPAPIQPHPTNNRYGFFKWMFSQKKFKYIGSNPRELKQYRLDIVLHSPK